MKSITYVGLDVHRATVSVAVAEGGRSGEVRQLGSFANRPDVLRKLVERLTRRGGELSFCYEAGPCGYGLHRFICGLGHGCMVVAPSLIPIKAGDRIKTDRRDAVMLAKLHRAGELTAVSSLQPALAPFLLKLSQQVWIKNGAVTARSKQATQLRVVAVTYTA